MTKKLMVTRTVFSIKEPTALIGRQVAALHIRLAYINRLSFADDELGARKRMWNICVYAAVDDHRLHQVFNLRPGSAGVCERKIERNPFAAVAAKNQP